MSLPSFQKKLSRLPAFTSFHNIYMKKFAKKIVIAQNFLTINNEQYTVFLLHDTIIIMKTMILSYMQELN